MPGRLGVGAPGSNVPLADGQIALTTDGSRRLPTLKELLAAGPNLWSWPTWADPKVVKAELSLAPVATPAELLGAPSILRQPVRSARRTGPGWCSETSRFDARETGKDQPADRSGCRTGQRHGCLRQRWLQGASSGAGQCDRCREAAATPRVDSSSKRIGLSPRSQNPARPYSVGAGWVEVLDKLGVIDNLLASVDRLVMQGYVLRSLLCRATASAIRCSKPTGWTGAGDPGQR